MRVSQVPAWTELAVRGVWETGNGFFFSEIRFLRLARALFAVGRSTPSLPVWDSGWLRVAGESLIRWVVPGDTQLAS